MRLPGSARGWGGGGGRPPGAAPPRGSPGVVEKDVDQMTRVRTRDSRHVAVSDPPAWQEARDLDAPLRRSGWRRCLRSRGGTWLVIADEGSSASGVDRDGVRRRPGDEACTSGGDRASVAPRRSRTTSRSRRALRSRYRRSATRERNRVPRQKPRRAAADGDGQSTFVERRRCRRNSPGDSQTRLRPARACGDGAATTPEVGVAAPPPHNDAAGSSAIARDRLS